MTTWDKLLIISTLGLALAGVFLARGTLRVAAAGANVVVRVDGTVRDRLPLNRDIVTLIKTKDGSCRLEIKDNQARIIRADCPKNLCVAQGAVGDRNGSIVCLPHKVVVSVEKTASPEETVDAVVR